MSEILQCSHCGVLLKKKQRVYCGRACQALGLSKRNSTARVSMRSCDFCGNEYAYHPDWKQDSATKYCKRECKDAHQRITYKSEGNPVFGTTWSNETRRLYETSILAYWALPENRNQRRAVMYQTAERLGRWLGQSDDSRERRHQTYLTVYGVDHPWMNAEIRQKCETTSLKLYGKHTWEIAHDAVKKHDTNIELQMAQLLTTHGIEFIHPYVIEDGTIRREFDFYIPTINTLIETDGDYYHANPKTYDQMKLDNTQLHTKKNDIFKDALAVKLKMRLLRFWETDIMQSGFVHVLTEALCAK